MSDKTTYTFSLEFAMRVCEVCRSRGNNGYHFQVTSKYDFYDRYRNEIENLRSDINEIENKLEVSRERLDAIRRALDYVEGSRIVVDCDDYFDYPDWMRVLFEEGDDEYVANLGRQESDIVTEINRLEYNLEEKKEELISRVRRVIKISLVDDDDWDELLRKIYDGEFEFSSSERVFTSP